jgi:predicted nucleic-acid-binding protein
MGRLSIYECLSGILGIPGLYVADAEILEEALELYKDTNADFGDACTAVLSKKMDADSVATFNKSHFKNLGVQLFDFNAKSNST